MEQTLNNKHLQRHTNLEDSNGIEGNGFVVYRFFFFFFFFFLGGGWGVGYE